VLVTKPLNKTPYELLLGRSPSIGFMRPFGCPVTILNTLNPLEKFDEKADEGFLVGYSVNSKAFRLFNSRTWIVQETLHINFLENKPNVTGIGPKWLFDIDTLTKSMNYQPVVAGNQPNDNAGFKENTNAGKVRKETVSAQQDVLLPLWSTGSQDPQNTDADVADVAFDVKENEHDVHVSVNGSTKTDNKKHDDKDKRDDKGKSHIDSPTRVRDLRAEFEEFSSNSTNRVNAVGALVNIVGLNLTNITNSFNTASPSVNVVSPNFGIARKSSFVDPSKYPDDPDMPELEDIVYSDDEKDVGAEADVSNLETNIPISSIPTTRVYKDHPVNQIIGDLNSAPQTRSMTRMVKVQGGLHQINDEDFHTCMFACFLSQEEPKKIYLRVKELQVQNGSFRNKKDERGIVIKNKARLVAQGHTQEEGIDYDEVFVLVARIEAIWLFLAYASFMGFMVYQMDVKSAFLYGTIEGRGKIDQTLFIKKQKGDILLVHVYVDAIIFGSTNKELCKAFEKLMKDKFQMSSMGELTFFRITNVKSASTPIESDKPLLKDPDVLIEAQQQISNESPLLGVNTPRCDENSIELKELMVFMAMATIKKVTNVVQLRALIDGKKVVVLEDVIKRDLHLDDADGIEFLLNEEIFAKLARMGYEKPPPKLTFCKAFFSAQWKFLIHILVQCVSAKRTAWNEFSCSMASAVIYLATGRKFNFSKYIFDSMVRNVDIPSKFLMYPCFLQVVMDNQVDDLTSHNTRYTSTALTQKVFANMRRVGKGFSGVETPLFASMLDPTPTTHAIPHASPPQEQLTSPHDSSMPLLTTLMETCASLSQKVAELEQDKHTQALEILKQKKRVKKLEKKKKLKSSGGCIQTGGKIEAIDADEDITLMDVETQEETLIKLKAENAKLLDEQISQKLHDEEVQKAATRDKQEKDDMERAQVAELEQDKHTQALEILKQKKRVKKLEKKKKSKSSGFKRGKIEAIDADEDITLMDVETQEETLIKLKAENAKLLDEQISQKLHDEEVQKAATRDKQEKDDMERAQVLQKQYDNKEEILIGMLLLSKYKKGI
nr:hypothetical protein [Tanacetum cinerariifolium]